MQRTLNNRLRVLTVICATVAVFGACTPTSAAPAGYSTHYTDIYTPSHQLIIELVASPGIDRVFAPAQLAANRLQAITGVSVVLWPYTTLVETGADGIIKIEIKAGANGGPCDYTAAQAWACTYQGLGPIGGTNDYMLSKQTIQIAPNALAVMTAAQLQAVVFHELGHAFGLEHYSDPYLGKIQVMSVGVGSGDVTDYQAGDINGLKSQHYRDTP